MKFYSTLPLNDNTNGFRFDLAGIKGLTRKRLVKRRWGFSSGVTMQGVHLGKRSVYIQKRKPARKLYDFALRDWNNALQLIFRFGK